MKAKLFSFLFASVINVGTMFSAVINGTCGANLTWTLNSKDSTLTIEGYGAMDAYSNHSPWHEYHSYITYLFLPNGLTSISKEAFYECDNLKSVEIPNNLTNIGRYAFYKCSKLETIIIPNGVITIGEEAFHGCISLTNVALPEGITQINYNTFYGCLGLSSIMLPSSLTTFQHDIFKNCSNLNQIILLTATPPSGGGSCGINNANSVLYVPEESVETYSNTIWWEDFAQILPYRKYLVTFKDWNGTTLKEDNVLLQTAAEAPEDPTRDGYSFIGWDKPFDNITEDITITALYAKNTYNFIYNCDETKGYILGSTSASYLEEVTITAISNYGYHFTQWSDGETENPRTFAVTQDTTFTAEFAKNIYNIEKLTNVTHGSISGLFEAEYLSEVTLEAIPNYGYHFTQWSDGETENPRTFIVTQDTTFTAEFAVDRTGSCGDEFALTWIYNPDEKLLTISGEGAFNDNMQCGVEARSELVSLIFEEGVTSIGDDAFKNCVSLQTISLSTTLKKINSNAFYNCENLVAIYNHRQTPANVLSTAFDGVDKFECVLYVPKIAVDLYKNAAVWRDFYNVEAIEVTPTAIENPSAKFGESRKLLRDGQILILRGEKVYTVTGQQIK